MPIFHHIQEEIDESASVSFIKGLISSPAASLGTEQKNNNQKINPIQFHMIPLPTSDSHKNVECRLQSPKGCPLCKSIVGTSCEDGASGNSMLV